MKTILLACLLTTALPSLLAASAATPVQNRSAATSAPALVQPSGSSPHSIAEIRAAYGQMTLQVELEHARLTAAARGDAEKLQDQIKRMDRPIARLKRELEKLAVLLDQNASQELVAHLTAGGEERAQVKRAQQEKASQMLAQAEKSARARVAREAAQARHEATAAAQRLIAELAAQQEEKRRLQEKLAAQERRVAGLEKQGQTAIDELRKRLARAVQDAAKRRP